MVGLKLLILSKSSQTVPDPKALFTLMQSFRIHSQPRQFHIKPHSILIHSTPECHAASRGRDFNEADWMYFLGRVYFSDNIFLSLYCRLCIIQMNRVGSDNF